MRIPLLLVALLSGCGLSNDEIIAETNKCRKAGFDIKIARDLRTNGILEIQCSPTDSSKPNFTGGGFQK